MMEGAFNKVLAAKNDVPAEQYAYFMDQLMHTVRSVLSSNVPPCHHDVILYTKNVQNFLEIINKFAFIL
jgi:hypothetical protein